MLYAVVGLIVFVSIGLATYALIKKSELDDQIDALREGIEEQDASHSAEVDALRRELSSRISANQKELGEQAHRHAREIDGHRSELARLERLNRNNLRDLVDRHAEEIYVLKAELAKLDKFRHIPEIIEKSRQLEAEIAARLTQAQEQADETVLIAHRDVERMKARMTAKVDDAEQRAIEIVHAANQKALVLRQQIITEMDSDAKKAKESLRVAEWQASNLIDEAQQQAKQIASQARKEAKEKTQKVDEVLMRATAYALEIREQAETRAREIGGQAYEALKRYEFYDAAARAKQNAIEGYADTYMVPASHVIDELAEEFGFHKAGERLKVARDRTRVMEKKGLAATCNYPVGWKRDYAISFVLSAFNGKIDSILARLKPANQGRLIQEIKDAYALVNHNGEVFKNARIHEEYLDARLEEVKWAVAVQRVKEKDRDEQRAIREQIRDEQKARKEIERAIKQAEREEETISKALDRARQEYESANAEDRAKYEAKLEDLARKLREAEEKNQRAISMAQQTKRGNVYVISNVGSFGEDVYKIGLSRRLDPMDRVRELGDASVPFSFDVHAMIRSEDAPALESALHRRFLQNQVNKVNRRKEFFRLKLQDIRSVVDELAPEVRWTMAAEARDHRDSLAMEKHLQEDPDFRRQWAESEAAYESRHVFDEDEAELEDEDIAIAEEAK